MSYAEAKAKYAALGVDTDAAIAKLKNVPASLHCWQGDDVRGFDQKVDALSGGIQTTGNYPGRARTPEALMADIDMVLKLCPGTKKMNLHACYAIFDEENGGWVDRDKIEPKHFKKMGGLLQGDRALRRSGRSREDRAGLFRRLYQPHRRMVRRSA